MSARNTRGQLVRELRDEFRLALARETVDQLVGVQADLIRERLHPVGAEQRLHRQAISGVLRRIQLDRDELAHTARAGDKVVGGVAREGLRVTEHFVDFLVMRDDPVSTVRGGVHDRTLGRQLGDPGLDVVDGLRESLVVDVEVDDEIFRYCFFSVVVIKYSSGRNPSAGFDGQRSLGGADGCRGLRGSHIVVGQKLFQDNGISLVVAVDQLRGGRRIAQSVTGAGRPIHYELTGLLSSIGHDPIPLLFESLCA